VSSQTIDFAGDIAEQAASDGVGRSYEAWSISSS
jgi:hypothetical protein